MKKIWEKIKTWLLAKWVAIKKWVLPKWGAVKEWFKNNWMITISYVVIFTAYSMIYEKGVPGAETILGLWLFISAAYGMYRLFEWLNKKKK
jgi:hypothetical protein